MTLDANTITVPTTRPAAPKFSPISRADDGTVTLNITNTVGLALTLEQSADLVSWKALSILTPAVNPALITDQTAGVATRFYRAFYP